MESKKISQLATELTPSLSDLTIIGDPTTGISKKITLSQMASLFTGTVEEYATLAAFPLVGVADTIYIALDTNVIYRYDTSLSAYVILSPNIINSLVFSDANGFDGTITLVGSVATLSITTALTLGSVPFIGASGALIQDNSNLFFDDTNNRLGIATASPTTPLDVFGSGIIGRLNATSTNNAYLGFASAGTNKWSIGNVQSDHRFRIYNEATTSELVSVLSTGEFGIGIANPTTKLHIDGAASALIANLDANVSVAKSVSFRSDNSSRINLEVSGTESGSNVGADFFLRTFTDAVSLLATPLTITRSTGLVTIPNLSFTTLTGIVPIANGGTGSATQNFVDLTSVQTAAGAKTFSAITTISNATASTSTSTGGLVVTGGLGIGGALFGTSATFSGNVTAAGLIGTGLYSNSWYAGSGSTLSLRTAASAVIADFSPTSSNILGKVGINGSTAPAAALTVYDQTSGSEQLRLGNSTGSGYWGIGRENNVTGDLYFNSGGTLRVTFASGGNVGIGTSTPTAKLDVNGEIRMTGSTLFRGMSSNTLQLCGGTSSSNIKIDGALETISMDTNGGTRLTITSDGNVGVGITGVYSDVKFMSRGASATSANYSFRSENSSGGNILYLRNDGLFGSGTLALSPFNFDPGGRIMYVNSVGQIGSLSSTRESKININTISNIDYIYKLNPVSFNMRKRDETTYEYTDEYNEEIRYGFIADEVEKLNEDLVVYNKNDGDKKLSSLDYISFIPVLVKAIQELKAEIEILKAK